jgi:hypothetical protein
MRLPAKTFWTGYALALYLVIIPKAGPAPRIAHQRSSKHRLGRNSGKCESYTWVLSLVDDNDASVSADHLHFDKNVRTESIQPTKKPEAALNHDGRTNRMSRANRGMNPQLTVMVIRYDSQWNMIWHRCSEDVKRMLRGKNVDFFLPLSCTKCDVNARVTSLNIVN